VWTKFELNFRYNFILILLKHTNIFVINLSIDQKLELQIDIYIKYVQDNTSRETSKAWSFSSIAILYTKNPAGFKVLSDLETSNL